MKVAVTGGSGVVGSAVVRHLVRAGHEVKALARSDQAASAVTRLGAIAVHGDILDSDSVGSLVTGTARAFHVAGINEMCVRDSRFMWEVNVEGTRNVIRACRQAEVPRLVHTSSASTIGHRKGEFGSETTAHRGWYLSEYERSKAAAEEIALEGGSGLDVVVVNPSSVQGPGRSTGTGRIFLAAARGRLPVVVDATVSLVDIDDCALGHLLAGDRGQPGERYLLSGHSLKVREAVALLSGVTGRKSSPLFVPAGFVTPAAALAEGFSRLVGKTPPLCREMVRMLAHGHDYDGSRATRELGLAYTPIEETLRRTVDWFGAEGLLT